MRKVLGLLLAVLVMAMAMVFSLSTNCFAGTKMLIFAWEQALPDPNDLDGWQLHYAAEEQGVYSQLGDLIPFLEEATEYNSDTIMTSPDGQRKQYFFKLRAVDDNGNKSGWSNIVSAFIDFESPDDPITFRVTVKIVPE